MPNKVKVLSPNVADDDEYYQIEARLTELSSLMLQAGGGTLPDAEWKQASIYLTARRVYDEFSIFAREHNRAMYMTREELRRELPGYTDLDDGIKYLLDKGLIKEGFIEVQ
jgi:hypothetical protein